MLGGGKSTLIQLLIGFIKPTLGVFVITAETTDDISFDVTVIKLPLVLQQTYTFNDTLRHNSTLGAEYDEMSLWRALEVSQMQDVITKQLLTVWILKLVGMASRPSGDNDNDWAIARMVLSNWSLLFLRSNISTWYRDRVSSAQSAANFWKIAQSLLIVAIDYQQWNKLIRFMF